MRRISRSVWLVRRGGERFALKELSVQGVKPGPYGVWAEVAALDALGAEGAPVARLRAFDPDAGLMLTEWIEGVTLHDAVTQSVSAGRAALAARVLAAQREVDSAFNRCWPHLLPWGAEGHRVQDETGSSAVDALRHEVRRRARRLADLAEGAARGDVLRPLPASSERRQAWEQAAERICRRPLSPGSLDLNAKNVLIAPEGRPIFLDFSSLGFDWPARRLVRSGAAISGGRFDSLFAHGIAGASADAHEEIADQHIFVWGLFVARLCAALRRPGSPVDLHVRRSWGDPAGRLPEALAVWASPWAPERSKAPVAGVAPA